MPRSLYDSDVRETFAAAARPRAVDVKLPGKRAAITIQRPFASPTDWRDHWIYFVLLDRFDNPAAPPRCVWDRSCAGRQGGTFEGVRRRLNYLHELGVGAIWLSPVMKNRQAPPDGSPHGYGITDFLEVDPRFGSAPGKAEEELARLVDEAHARGMYVILDVVINHAGDIFAYNVDGRLRDAADWRDTPYPVIAWRDAQGTALEQWPRLPAPETLPRDAGVWPAEFQHNRWWRRQGAGEGLAGDFGTLKELDTEQTDAFFDFPVRNLIIRAWQHAIARFDVDGFRVDTLKHVERDFALTFCNAVREYAAAIGKRNFFIFGESRSADEAVLAAYTGRFTHDPEGEMGADAALDFPLQAALAPVAKGFDPPSSLSAFFQRRRDIHQTHHLYSTHGEASRFFVTFLDTHDEHQRFLCPRDGGDWTAQLQLAVACLFGLQGIPCLYYGTEQGLIGTQEIYDTSESARFEHVREALWGKPGGFDRAHPVYREIRRMARVRRNEPALRYGRQYFRDVSGNDIDFGPARQPGGILAFSRILNDREVVVAANTNTAADFSGWVVVAGRLNDDAGRFRTLYSNFGTAGLTRPTSGPARFHDGANPPRDGWARRLAVHLKPMEVQILARER